MPTRHDSVPHPDPDPDPVPVPPHDPDPDPDPHRGSVPDPGPAPRSARGGWLLARLRAAPGGALAFAALVCVAVFTAAALPRALDASSDAALRSALDRARPADRMVSATASAGPEAGVRDELRRRIAPGAVRTAYAALSDAVRSPFRRPTVRRRTECTTPLRPRRTTPDSRAPPAMCGRRRRSPRRPGWPGAPASPRAGCPLPRSRAARAGAVSKRLSRRKPRTG